MRIGVLSDSHFKRESITSKEKNFIKIYKRIKWALQGVDHIIHAGDVVCEEFIQILESIAPVSVVQGNMDRANGLEKWPKNLQLDFEGVKIGVSHELVNFTSFNPKEIQVFIYGHTHVASIKESPEGVLMVNPGSVSRPRAPPKKRFAFENPSADPTIAILTIENGLLSSILKRI